MSWFHVDDKFHGHPKVAAASEAGLGAWVKVGSYCALHGTDGTISGAAARRLCTKKGLADAVAARLLILEGDAYQLSGFLDCNPSASQVAARREKWAEKKQGQRGRVSPGDSTGDTVSCPQGSPHDGPQVCPPGVLTRVARTPAPAPAPADPSGGCAAPPAPAVEALQLRPVEPPKLKAPKPKARGSESPEAIGWRTWRAAYEKRYGRGYRSQDADGKAMQRLTGGAVRLVAELGRTGPDALERLMVHTWRCYLTDSGQRDYLVTTCHRLQDAERGLAAYGTPWDGPRRSEPETHSRAVLAQREHDRIEHEARQRGIDFDAIGRGGAS